MDKKFQTYYQDIERFVLENLEGVLKPPRAFIRYPFIDPGSVYEGNVWDWDTFWSVYALTGLRERMGEALFARVLRHAQGNVLNFLDHQLEDGYIPMMIEVKDLNEPYLNKKHKEGVLMNMHKPFLCAQTELVARYSGGYGFLGCGMEPFEKYFDCYDRYYFNQTAGLYVWRDDIMIGMDNDPASFGRPKASTANIFLNAFMVEEMRAMAAMCEAFNRPQRAAFYRQKRERLTGAIQSECWDRRDRFFYSADVDVKTRRFDWFHQGLGVFWKTLPIKVRVWSAFIPMWAGFATPGQAAALSMHMFDPDTFQSPFGITTLAKDEKMFDLSATNNPSNWLGPIWVVANYVAFRALMNYGYRDKARAICEGTLTLLGEDLKKTGSLHEYYNPFTGEPVMNGGFINWNVLALTMARELEGR